ncbi:phosphatase PAP2 family protein [Solimonas sp. C16B3]|uniref:Phosphatase PAP2 family protein n=2 Tax=Solimonas marina TaxID=2714601 RepID=A0A970B600_9GAMM|nr:phosphatase PAP2 family protein [Solimonas marina]
MAVAACGIGTANAESIGKEWQDDPDLAAGDTFQVLNPLIAVGVTLYKGDYQGTKQYAYNFAAVFAATEALKYSVDHTRWGTRPNGGNESFPSGHTSAACSAAAFLSDRYGWQYGAPLYATALFTAYSRVDEHYHHWRDVIAGCALSWGVSKLITTPYVDASRVSVAPMMEPHAVGVQLSFAFAP